MPASLDYKVKPINLLRKAQRGRRNRNGGIGKWRNKNKKRRLAKQRKQPFEWKEFLAIKSCTNTRLEEICQGEPLLADIKYAVTLEELEEKLTQGPKTTVFVQRNGLPTLTIVLRETKPTIAQLKRAIMMQARVQLERDLRAYRNEYRNVIEHKQIDVNNANSGAVVSGDSNKENIQEHNDKKDVENVCNALHISESTTYDGSYRSCGELVCSAKRIGHLHRPCVSWRYLWRAYTLFNIATQLPINDKNGRQLLSDCGIENLQTLKFTNREKYFGRLRQ